MYPAGAGVADPLGRRRPREGGARRQPGRWVAIPFGGYLTLSHVFTALEGFRTDLGTGCLLRARICPTPHARTNSGNMDKLSSAGTIMPAVLGSVQFEIRGQPAVLNKHAPAAIHTAASRAAGLKVLRCVPFSCL